MYCGVHHLGIVPQQASPECSTAMPCAAVAVRSVPGFPVPATHGLQRWCRSLELIID